MLLFFLFNFIINGDPLLQRTPSEQPLCLLYAVRLVKEITQGHRAPRCTTFHCRGVASAYSMSLYGRSHPAPSRPYPSPGTFGNSGWCRSHIQVPETDEFVPAVPMHRTMVPAKGILKNSSYRPPSSPPPPPPSPPLPTPQLEVMSEDTNSDREPPSSTGQFQHSPSPVSVPSRLPQASTTTRDPRRPHQGSTIHW